MSHQSTDDRFLVYFQVHSMRSISASRGNTERAPAMDERQKSIDLLNDTHDFPTHVMVKVIGVNSVAFVSRVVVAVRESLAHEIDPPYRTRETPSGRHVAVTLEPFIEHAEQVLIVYAKLRTLDDIVMLL